MGDEIKSEAMPETTPVPAKKNYKSCIVIAIIGVLILVIVAVGGFWAYAKFVKKANSITDALNYTSEVFNSKNFNSECKYNDAELCKYINNWKNITSYSMNTTTTGSDGKKNTSAIIVDGEDKTQMTSTTDGSENYNMITIGKTYYQKDYSDGKWFKYTINDTNNENSTIENDAIDVTSDVSEPEDTTTFKKIGQEDCGSLKCWKYQVIDTTNTDSTEYIYFDNKEYLLRKSRSELKDGSVTEITYSYTKVSITEPSPTKDGNPYDSYTGSVSESSITQDLEGENESSGNYSDGSVSEDSTDAGDYSPSVDESE